jgi:hypothetical protein
MKPTREELQKMVNDGKTLKEIASAFGKRSANTAKNWIEKFGVTQKTANNMWTEEDCKTLLREYAKGGLNLCCQTLGRSKNSIYQQASRLGVKRNFFKDRYTKDVLLQEYVEKNKSVQQIAEEQGGEFWHVYAALISNGIPIDKTGKYFGKDHHNWKGYKEISQTHWGDIKRSSSRRSREISFAITVKEAWGIYIKQDRKCALSGVPIAFSKTGANRYESTTASLDRIDSNGIYSMNNCQWLHKTVNMMKGSMSDEDLAHWCLLITSQKKD